MLSWEFSTWSRLGASKDTSNLWLSIINCTHPYCMHQAMSGWNTKLCIINLHCLTECQFWVYEQLFTEVHPSQPPLSFLNCSFCSLLLKPPLVTKDIVFSNLTYHYFFTDSRLQSWLEPLSQWTCCRKLLSSNFLYASINLQKIQFFHVWNFAKHILFVGIARC